MFVITGKAATGSASKATVLSRNGQHRRRCAAAAVVLQPSCFVGSSLRISSFPHLNLSTGRLVFLELFSLGSPRDKKAGVKSGT